MKIWNFIKANLTDRLLTDEERKLCDRSFADSFDGIIYRTETRYSLTREGFTVMTSTGKLISPSGDPDEKYYKCKVDRIETREYDPRGRLLKRITLIDGKGSTVVRYNPPGRLIWCEENGKKLA